MIMLGEEATPENLAVLRHDLGLDQPSPSSTWLGWRTSCAATLGVRSGHTSR